MKQKIATVHRSLSLIKVYARLNTNIFFILYPVLYVIQDRGDPDAVDRHFNQIPFDARFISQNPEYLHMQDWGGIDGFTMDVSPLYKVKKSWPHRFSISYLAQCQNAHILYD